MNSKVIVLCVITIAAAQSQDGHSHGHAISSQSIVLHASHGHEHQKHQEHHVSQHQEHHGSQHHEESHHDYYAHPKYAFEYKVEDPHTGDHKYQHEARDGDHVTGEYGLHEADGTVRVVKYSSDKHTGFNAVVKHEGKTKHIVPKHHH